MGNGWISAAGNFVPMLVACVVGLSFRAQALPLVPGNTVATTGTTALEPGTILTNATTGFAGVNVNGATNFTGTLQLQVVRETVNGTLDFYYQIFNAATSANTISRLTAADFTGFVTDVDWTNNAAPGVGPAYADRTTADTVGFGFLGAPFGCGTIVPGTNSAVIFIKTDATQYTLGTVSLIDGATANVLAFAPLAGSQIPEPSTSLLVGFSMLLGLCVWRRRQV